MTSTATKIQHEPDSKVLAQLKDVFAELQVIAQRVGGDFGMSVEIGVPGKGSFFDTVHGTITLDPVHVLHDPVFAKFTAGHEGSHRAITLSPQKLGLSDELIEKLYSQIGFGFIQNITEDGAVNDSMCRRFPGMVANTRAVYQDMFSDPDAVLSTPEVQQAAARLGRWPAFARFGSEILRDWNELREKQGVKDPLPSNGKTFFSPTTSSAIKTALNQCIYDARQAISDIPVVACKNPDQLREHHRNRFQITAEKVYPAMAGLVEKDFNVEKNRQALNEFLKLQSELQKKQTQLQKQQSAGQGNSQAAQQLQSEIDQLNDQIQPYEQLPKQVRQEIEKAIDQAIQEQVDKFVKDLKQAQKALQNSQSTQDKLQEQLEQAGTSAPSAAEQRSLKEELELEKAKAQSMKDQVSKQIDETLGQAAPDLASALKSEVTGNPQAVSQGAENFQETEAQTAGQKPAKPDPNTQPGKDSKQDSKVGKDPATQEANLPSAVNPKDLKKDLENKIKDNKTSQQDLPLPYDKLSEQAQKQLDTLPAAGSPEQKTKWEENSAQELKQFEDTVNKSVESKLNSQKAPRHEASAEKSQGAANDSDNDQAASANQSTPIVNDGNQSKKTTHQKTNRTPRNLDQEFAQMQTAMQKLREATSEDLTEYEQALSHVGEQLLKIKARFSKILHPTDNVEMETGKRSGKLDLKTLMRSINNPAARLKAFKRKAEPLELDHAFGNLVDRSVSMEEGGKAIESFHASVMLAELLDWKQLNVPNAHWVFSDRRYAIKDFSENVRNPTVQKQFGAILRCNGGTQDASAIAASYKELKDRKEKYKFLIVISDAESGQTEELRRVVELIKSEHKVILVHFGLGVGTEDSQGIYPYSFGNLRVTGTGKALLFSEVYTRFVEEALRNPRAFFSYTDNAEVLKRIRTGN